MTLFGRLGLQAINISLVLGMIAMSALVLVNVVLRYGFESGLPFSVEVSRLFFVWIVFLGAVAALGEGSHISVEMLTRLLPRPAALVLAVGSHLVMLWICYLLARGSYALTVINLNNRSPISGIPVAWLYGAGLAFSVGAALVLCAQLWRIVRGGDVHPGLSTDEPA